VPQRNLTVFRDEDDFQGVEYTASVERSLRESAKLIVISSPRSAAKPTEEADAALRSALRESKVRRVVRGDWQEILRLASARTTRTLTPQERIAFLPR